MAPSNSIFSKGKSGQLCFHTRMRIFPHRGTGARLLCVTVSCSDTFTERKIVEREYILWFGVSGAGVRK